MKKILAVGAVLAFLVSPAFAQSGNTNQANQSQTNMQSNDHSARQLAAGQKIKQDLQNAGFTNLNIVAESFVVQARSKDGDPMVMTIGPHGMSVFEAMNSGSGANSSGNTTGSATISPSPTQKQ